MDCTTFPKTEKAKAGRLTAVVAWQGGVPSDAELAEVLDLLRVSVDIRRLRVERGLPERAVVR